ncbi:hypothetical protein ACJRO7_035764 [Eucalyptus globulus]|uniref:AMP-dependent synthetase/ligase domain-containing protein n=1 Tax=Eucalyptus globulus TaxID=34317 RepID=A0ABD3J8C3_EUCGL
MEGLLQCPANYVPLTPISFLERAAFVYGNKVSIIYGNTRYTWRQTHQRCLKLASALTGLKISRGDIVSLSILYPSSLIIFLCFMQIKRGPRFLSFLPPLAFSLPKSHGLKWRE